MKRVKIQAAFIGTMAIALSASMLLGSVTNDRVYSLGDHSFEGASAGQPVGYTTTDDREVTFDSEFDDPGFFDAQDLEAKDAANDGSPTYVDVSSRPGAGSTLGVSFDGVNDRLEATPFNRPDWYWDQSDFGFPLPILAITKASPAEAHSFGSNPPTSMAPARMFCSTAVNLVAS